MHNGESGDIHLVMHKYAKVCRKRIKINIPLMKSIVILCLLTFLCRASVSAELNLVNEKYVDYEQYESMTEKLVNLEMCNKNLTIENYDLHSRAVLLERLLAQTENALLVMANQSGDDSKIETVLRLLEWNTLQRTTARPLKIDAI